MDGGRILRALLAYRMCFARATQVAASIGQALAFLFGLLGLFGNPLLLFIVLFVYLAAAAEAHSVQMRQVARGILAADGDHTLREPVATQASSGCRAGAGSYDAARIPGGGWCGPAARCADAQRDDPGTDRRWTQRRGNRNHTREIPVVQPRQNLEDVIRLLQETGSAVVGVMETAGRLVGLITPENIGKIMMVRAAQPQRPTVSLQQQAVTSP
jgi:stage IV sporulation protein FB